MMSARAVAIAAAASEMVTAAVVVRPASVVLYGRLELASSLETASVAAALRPMFLASGRLRREPPRSHLAGSDTDLFAALRLGVHAYLLKSMNLRRLPDVLPGVSTSEAAIPRTLAARVLQQFPGGAALAAADGRHSPGADQPRMGSAGAAGAGSVDSPDCRPAGDLGERGTCSRSCDRAEARGVRADRGRGPPPSALDGVTAQKTERSADPVSLPGRRAGRVWVCRRMCLTCSGA